MNRIKKHLDIILDNICYNGCNYVRECISKIQTNETVTEVIFIDISEQQIILQELISIMEVYDMQEN